MNIRSYSEVLTMKHLLSDEINIIFKTEIEMGQGVMTGRLFHGVGLDGMKS